MHAICVLCHFKHLMRHDMLNSCATPKQNGTDHWEIYAYLKGPISVKLDQMQRQ